MEEEELYWIDGRWIGKEAALRWVEAEADRRLPVMARQYLTVLAVRNDVLRSLLSVRVTPA